MKSKYCDLSPLQRSERQLYNKVIYFENMENDKNVPVAKLTPRFQIWCYFDSSWSMNIYSRHFIALSKYCDECFIKISWRD